MFEKGLDVFHLKKPGFSKKQLKKYLNQIPEKYHKNIVLHSHYSLVYKYNVKGLHISKLININNLLHRLNFLIFKRIKPKLLYSCSCHNLDRLLNIEKKYDYVFLSPIYSKDGTMNKKFTSNSIKNTLSQINVETFALGGISEKNFSELKKLNFQGISLMASIWYEKDQPLSLFESAKRKLNLIS